MGKDNFVDALQDASLEIEEGEMVAVMGPSGSGKSTLLHILGCLDSVNSGEVWLDGRRVDKLSRRELAQLRRNEVGFIFQTFNLVPSFTALENVMLAAEYAGKGRREAREAARSALAQVGLADRGDHQPTELSGGQQQRVAIARALVNGPKVIFGDEPTGNLDSASSAEIVAMMHRDQPRDRHHLRPCHPRPGRGRHVRPGAPHAGRQSDQRPQGRLNRQPPPVAAPPLAECQIATYARNGGAVAHRPDGLICPLLTPLASRRQASDNEVPQTPGRKRQKP